MGHPRGTVGVERVAKKIRIFPLTGERIAVNRLRVERRNQFNPMKLNIANNSPLRPSMHEGFRRAEERDFFGKPRHLTYFTGGHRLHRKQPKTISEILSGKKDHAA